MELKALREQKSVVILIRCVISKSIYWKYNAEKKKCAMKSLNYHIFDVIYINVQRSSKLFFNHQEVKICLKSGKK